MLCNIFFLSIMTHQQMSTGATVFVTSGKWTAYISFQLISFRFFFYFGAGREGISCFQFSVDVVMYCWLLCYSLHFRLPELMQFLNILYILIIHYFSSSFYIQYLPKVSNELLRWKKEKVLSSFSLMAMIL